MAVKEFLHEKEPRTDVRASGLSRLLPDALPCDPHFKTVDLSLLNTEGAQPKFANAANSANNAVKMGYLVSLS